MTNPSLVSFSLVTWFHLYSLSIFVNRKLPHNLVLFDFESFLFNDKKEINFFNDLTQGVCKSKRSSRDVSDDEVHGRDQLSVSVYVGRQASGNR